MSNTVVVQSPVVSPRSRRNIVRAISATRGFCVRRPLGAAGGLVIVVLLVLAFAPGLIAPYGPDAQAPADALQSVSGSHLFGTDNFGRDVFSRVVYGARTSLFIGVGAVVVGLGAAILIGATSAYAGGWWDALVQRLVDAIMALPWLVVLMSMMSLLGPGERNSLLVIGLLTAPGTSRVIRGSVLRLKGTLYVDAARAMGCSDTRIVVRHILPNILPEIIVLASIGVGAAILAESSLSFLGFGVVPPAPDWGYMLGVEGRRFLTTAPWLAIFPGAAIALCVFSFNVLGDALRDELDPRLRA